MARRALSADETTALGLPTAPRRRAVDPAEAAVLGLGAAGPGKAVAATRGALQSTTRGWSDEAGGYLESKFPRLALPPEEFFDPDVPTPAPKTYAEARDSLRAVNADTRAAEPGAFLAGEIGGALASAVGGGYVAAAGEGALSGAGYSDAPDALGVAGDAALGGGLGLAGKAIGDKVGEGLDAVKGWVLRRAQQGKAAAQELAGAQAKDLVGQGVQQAKSAAGSAASKARNVMENVEGIDLPAENARRTVGEAREALLGQVDALDDALEAATARARALGVDPASLSPGRQGEFLAKGGRLDKAQKAAKSIQALQAAREKLVGEYRDLGARAVDEVLPDTYGPLREAQASLRSDPKFEDLKQNVLRNSLDDFDPAAADAVAKREAYRQALASQPQDEAALAERLLSGEEFKNQVGQRLKRYAAPLAGSVLGGGVGAGVGLAVGNDPTDAVAYALGGAGLRPAIGAIRRMADQPSVRNKAWKGIEALAKAAPESFGRYSGAVAAALARGPEALRALEKVLNDTSAEWRAMRKQQGGTQP